MALPSWGGVGVASSKSSACDFELRAATEPDSHRCLIAFTPGQIGEPAPTSEPAKEEVFGFAKKKKGAAPAAEPAGEEEARRPSSFISRARPRSLCLRVFTSGLCGALPRLHRFA